MTVNFKFQSEGSNNLILVFALIISLVVNITCLIYVTNSGTDIELLQSHVKELRVDLRQEANRDNADIVNLYNIHDQVNERLNQQELRIENLESFMQQ